MSRIVKWIAAIVAALVLLLAAAVIGLRSWTGSADFRQRVAREVSTAAGVPVELGAIGIDVWPVPAVTVDRVQVRSNPPLTLERIEARPTWGSLLRGEPRVATLRVRDAVIPQEAVAAIGLAYRKAHTGAAAGAASPRSSPSDGFASLPRHIVLDGVTWVDAKGRRSVIDARSALGEDALPDSVSVVVRQGRFEGARARIEREGEHWNVDARLGGGTIVGKLQPVRGAAGEPLLDGVFDTSGVEVSALTEPSRTLSGKLEAHTTLRADLRDPGAIVDTLRSETKFTVRSATVHGIDLAKAVQTVGLSRGGETQLDTLAGTVITRGRTVQVNNLVAASGVLSANGAVEMAADQRLSGHVTVALAAQAAGGALGVPLVVGGTLDSPSVTLSRGALLGAAVGTAIAPGLGTGAGANLGDKLGQGLKGLFGK